MNALVIGHDHVAGLGHLGPALTRRGYALDLIHVVPRERFERPDVDVTFPDPTGRDLVVTLGAPWPRDRIRGWAEAETAFLRRCDAAGVPVLGICFGAQLLAEALGGSVRTLDAPRTGWHPVSSDAGVPAGPWFCWNADQLVAPPGAEVLATSPAGDEVFRLRGHVGVQFHPEMTPDLLADWLTVGTPDPDGHLTAATARHSARAREALEVLLDQVVGSPRS